jgi:hypothetical protein
MGHSDVFVHVGDHVRLQAPNGKYVAPLVTGGRVSSQDTAPIIDPWTGSFGSSDFIHSLLGEATDHIVGIVLSSPF